MKNFDFSAVAPVEPNIYVVSTPLEDPSILLTSGCHVDHEGFDLNEIEQAYYKAAGIIMSHDTTWYKDGDGSTTAIIQPWFTQTNKIVYSAEDQLIIDHSHFVYKYPIRGEAEEQIRQYIPQRPELLRLLSTRFKCGLDFCVDLFTEAGVQPIVHIEWDYYNFKDMHYNAYRLSDYIESKEWMSKIQSIKEFNQTMHTSELGAFEQADFRAIRMFGDRAYKLIPTLTIY